MNAKTTGSVLVIVGLVVALLAACADSIGLGAEAGMGSKQIAGLVIGVVIAAVGLVLTRQR